MNGDSAGFSGLHVAIHFDEIDRAFEVDATGRRDAHAEVRFVAPIHNVVPRFATGPRVIADLILRKPRAIQRLHHGAVMHALVLGLQRRDGAAIDGALQRRAILIDQSVRRQVVRVQRDGFVQIAAQVVVRLRRQPVHQIDRHILKPCGARHANGFAPLACAVHASQQFQQMRLKRLHAKTDAVHAARQQKVELRRFGRPRIGFDRELFNTRQVDLRRQDRKEARQFRDVQRARSAPAQENRFRREAVLRTAYVQRDQARAQFFLQRIQIALGARGGVDLRREVAVRAQRRAKWKMHIQRVGIGLRRFHPNILNESMRPV